VIGGTTESAVPTRDVAMSRKKKPDGAETKELFFFFFFFFWAPERRLFKRSIRWSTNVYTTHFFFFSFAGKFSHAASSILTLVI
jgi:hypothetical protein